MKCKMIPQINLSHWKERASCQVDKINIDVGRTIHVTPCVSCTCTKEGVRFHLNIYLTKFVNLLVLMCKFLVLFHSSSIFRLPNKFDY